MSKNILKRNTYIKYSITDHFKKYKWIYLILFICLILGLILGFVVGFKRADNFSLSDLPDSSLVDFINKKISAASLFFSRICSFFGLIFLFWCINCKKFLSFITFIIVFYRAFLIGINCAILMFIYKFGGAINVFLVILPTHLIALVLLLCFGAVCAYFAFNEKNIGYGTFSGYFFREAKAVLFTVVVGAILCYLFEALLLPHISSAIFIGIN
ncbi:MAG: hypothetical protein IJ837_03360 [Clostridia bacterium]|nr:hypothetical protein [Clostridia bacterium]